MEYNVVWYRKIHSTISTVHTHRVVALHNNHSMYYAMERTVAVSIPADSAAKVVPRREFLKPQDPYMIIMTFMTQQVALYWYSEVRQYKWRRLNSLESNLFG